MNTEFIEINDIELLQFKSMQLDNLFHFSTTIKGGISEDTYASFNLGFYAGDNPENVYENRVRLSSSINIDPENLIIPYQTHEDKIGIIDEHFMCLSDGAKLEYLNGIDALITNQKNICIGVTTADCVPIIIFDPKQHILAAIHAGWKGSVLKIAAKTVSKMIELFGCNPNDLLAGIAPCISQECFEVGEDVVNYFTEANFPIEEIAYRNTQSGKMHIDLQLANKGILLEAGIPSSNIEIARLCTFSNPDKFFSARRQSIHSGRMITGGVLK